MITNDLMYASEFQKIVLSEIERVVKSLPPGVATYYVGPSKHDPGMIALTFKIQPANPNAASIAGAVADGEVTISVGCSRREWWTKQASASEGAKCALFVSRICRAVFAGNFKERIRVDRSGRRVSSCLKLSLDGKTSRMWQNRLLTDLLTITKKREVQYEPYVIGQ